MPDEESRAIVQAIEDLKSAFYSHCERGAGEIASIVSTLQAVKESVEAVTRSVSRGGNGKSLVERIGALEIQLDNLADKVDQLSEDLAEQPKLRLAFWGPIAASLIAATSAVIVALLK